MIYPQNIEQKIDFQVIRDGLKGCCMSSLGKERVDAMQWLTHYPTVCDLLSRVREMMALLSDPALAFPHGEIYDLREALSRIRIEGLFMDEAELFSLRKVLDYAAQLERFFATLDKVKYPLLSCESGVGRPNSLESRVGSPKSNIGFLIASIDAILDRYGKMRDNASPELARIRKEISASQGSVSRALNAILRQAQAEGILDKDASPTMREGRLVLPVPPAYKRKIGGIVHDESATGKTVFIEPQQVVEANNRIRELEGEERRERIRILLEITAKLRPEVPQILETENYLGEVDFLRAKALFAIDMHAIVPELSKHPMIDWREAYHPVLLLNFRRQGKTVVPLTIQLTNRQSPISNNRILVISGPNAGGKSVCLKTVAMLQYMIQCGLPVPMNEASKMGFFKQLLMDIGDEQSIEDDLSTYSSHLRNMKHFVRYADAQTLLLIDEFGTGTEPMIGGAIAEAVLSQLNEQRAFGVITTHYGNLKHLAERTEGIINGAMLYDRGQLKPLFQLSIGQAGSSFAVEIARQIGLPETIIQRATDIVGEEHIDYDKHLQDIARDKRYWENKRQNIRQREKHLEEKIAHYEEQLASIKAKKRAIIEEANAEAADLLRKSNATIERTIREIKEAKAEKKATQAARQKVESLKTKVERQASKTSPTSKTSKTSTTTQSTKQPKVLRDLSDLKILTKNPAKLLQEQEANNRASGSRSLGQVRISNVTDELRRKKLSFNRELDIRGLRVDEALEILIAYIDDALMVNAEQVSILHGTGTGALKQVVRDYLAERQKSMRRLKSGDIVFHDGDPDRGGAGITIVEL
ncbi:MAG: Smr/MutS family protein [Paludibacteraceae bacterium]|nr:Smr/MutS family protein [Paludibacteraceae bacterium]